jgi:4-amino-4-deoxy-L-arabinose transferase-like glycosyltransferase
VTLSRRLTFTAFGICFLLWVFFLFHFPTLDFDEALYRRVADNMKTARNPWNLNWDQHVLYHKPPVFYWLVWMMSDLVDGSAAAVSTLAARLPSFLSSVGILAYLYLSGKRFGADVGRVSALAFLCGLFPLLTATAVLFDPLQTLCLMPALVIPSILFWNGGNLCTREWVLWGVSLFAANATKGLNGMIVPTIAFGMHALWAMKTEGFQKILRLGLKFLIFSFLPGLALTALYYGWLDHKIGPSFTHEFIWIQHFERGTQAMEQHSGSFFYHFFVIFLGGGVLISLLLDRMIRAKPSFTKYGFPLTYSLSFIVIFGLSATKLPHYSWPVWPALALYLGMIWALPESQVKNFRKLVSLIPVILLGVFSLGLVFFKNMDLLTLSQTPSFLGLFKYFTGFTFAETTSLVFCAFLCSVFVMFKNQFLAKIEICAIFSTTIALCLAFGLARTLDNLLVKPFYEIATSLKNDGAKAEDCIRYSGTLSPTFSIALSPELLHNRCEPYYMKYLVAPEWKADECERLNFKRIDQKSYLVLCKKGN